jgi:hypothetical protein
VQQAGYPGSRMVPAVGALLSLLALKPIPLKLAQATASCYLGFANHRGNKEAVTYATRIVGAAG